MRIALLLVLAAGCIPAAGPPPESDYDDYDDDGWTGSGGDPFYGCRRDSECGSQVCARDGACYPATSIRAVVTTWTVGGEVATTASCTTHPDLFIRFATTNGESFGYSPVPCRNGKFTIDKLPMSYSRVELGGNGSGFGTSATITSTGTAMIDLP
ncbi:MAG: hypothetical protein H0T42_31375 [Deltaproteobacteria bacterium]|nr:hypothetical protein [Deltaproteobacteria bacterium]